MSDQANDVDLEFLPVMPQNLDIGIGCIGSGFIMSDCHLVAYRAAGLQPLGIASRRIENASAVAQRHSIESVYASYHQLLQDRRIEVLDIAVPPDCLLPILRDVVTHPHIRGVLAQKPLGVCLQDAQQIVDLCHRAGIVLCVNQNMRYDQSVRACEHLLRRGDLGDPVLATLEMRAIPHWMPWQQRQGWLTCRIMSIHHLDTLRFWFGNPNRVYASFAKDPRTEFAHSDGIGLYLLEYESGLRCMICDDVWTGPAREGGQPDLGIHYRIEGTTGLAKGSIGWPHYPQRVPSRLDYTTIASGNWQRPRWDQVWFPDAFLGPMAELLVALEQGQQPSLCGDDNLATMALVDACYLSAANHQSVELDLNKYDHRQ
ncbi:Gfo/Idh/MocA family oxidoreductase [Stieleria sp. TO1_6]|uniref:Gfo/Idh/MocA family protein n=1 Tax=Stieleria tagensis TaxID=2956795 RepID=UPI00209B61F9|nr:Gfo/Idh/MocA family oxidoreductase [Stieleria tagensis]MCO8120378.1 Gfo/Idh/MocA family oxidoreductase [Stieleria tagensis]